MEDFRAMGERLRNWGRWGEQDERGTVNLITPERLVAAAALIRQGKVFDLGIPFDGDGPQPGGGRINPVRLMSETGADQLFPAASDTPTTSCLCPFRGRPSGTAWPTCTTTIACTTATRHRTSGRTGPATTPSTSRPRALPGEGCCSTWPGCTAWSGSTLATSSPRMTSTAASEAHHVEVRAGDIVAFRTGWRKKFLTEHDARSFMAGEPGLGQACAEWLHAHDVAAVCSDNWAVEVLPGEVEDVVFNVHMVLIRDMGMTLGEILDLEELSADCAEDGIYEFFFCAPPIKFTAAVGSPINPLAIK